MKCSAKCAKDSYHPESNPDGLINLGTAVNALSEEMIEERISKVRHSWIE